MTFNVLSLFGGIEGGFQALKNLNIKVDNYFYSEVDSYAIKIAKKNHPEIIEVGDVKGVKGSDLPKINLLIGGSPCQGFSFAGKQLNFDDPRSKLFFEFVRILKEVKPDCSLLENVRMKKEYQDVISNALEVEPILIDSALLSGQSRKRNYWTNIKEDYINLFQKKSSIPQPGDKGILLKDILESGYTDREKSFCIDANYSKTAGLKDYILRKKRQVIFKDESSIKILANIHPSGKGQNGNVYDVNGKSPTLTTNKGEGIKISLDKSTYRKLTPIECERLQGYPDNYTEGISNYQRYKCLGNSFQIDTVEYILSHLLEILENKLSA